MPKPLDRKGLMEYALRALSQRAMSAADLRMRLLRRAADAGDVDTVIEQLKEPGFVNDNRFAESYAAARLENQGFGRMRVLRDLRQRRVSTEVAESAVARTFDGTDEVELIRQYLERKYRGKRLPEFLSEEKNLLSAYRRLRTAGFGGAAAIRVLKQYAAAADQLEEMDEAAED
jgi:regulatory protein